MAAPSSPPKRLSLLPPELDDIDAAWGEESPTVVPSRSPSLPARPPSISINTVEPEDEDNGDRVTFVPDEPQDEFARRVMAAAATEPPPGPGAPSKRSDDSSLELMLDEELSFQRITEPTWDPGQHPSTFPTAPPPRRESPLPEELDPRRVRTVPRPGALRLPTSDAPSEGPPTYREPLSALERARRAVTPRVRPEVSAFGQAPLGIDIAGRFSSAPPPEAEATREMKDRFAIGDFSGALEVAEAILRREPAQLEAKNVASKCREVLQDMYASRIESMDRPLVVTMGPDQIRWLSLDHRAGFLLSMVDGITTADELLDVSGMPRLDALRILCELLDQKVVGLGR